MGVGKLVSNHECMHNHRVLVDVELPGIRRPPPNGLDRRGRDASNGKCGHSTRMHGVTTDIAREKFTKAGSKPAASWHRTIRMEPKLGVEGEV